MPPPSATRVLSSSSHTCKSSHSGRACNEKRIKISRGSLSPIEYRVSLGLAAQNPPKFLSAPRRLHHRKSPTNTGVGLEFQLVVNLALRSILKFFYSAWPQMLARSSLQASLLVAAMIDSGSVALPS